MGFLSNLLTNLLGAMLASMIPIPTPGPSSDGYDWAVSHCPVAVVRAMPSNKWACPVPMDESVTPPTVEDSASVSAPAAATSAADSVERTER